MITSMDSAVCLYEVGLDGTLNGYYTNLQAAGSVFNEICKKINADEIGLTGTYRSTWFEEKDEERKDRLLIISEDPEVRNGRVFRFSWCFENNQETMLFIGVGYFLKDRLMVVHYYEPN